MYIELELKQKQVYTILINNWDEEITGVFIDQGKEWLLFYDNQNDFLVEGFRFINKQKIDEIIREEDEMFKEKIFQLKYSKLSFDAIYNLNDTVELFRSIKNEDTLLHFDTDDDEVLVVGKLEEVATKNFTLVSMTTTGEWGESCTCQFSELSTIAIHNDYLNSLSLLHS